MESMNYIRVAVSLSTLVSCSFAAAQAPFLDETDAAIRLQVEGSDLPNLTDVLAQIGQPQDIALKGGETVRSLVEARCGVVRPAYISALLKANEGNLSAENTDSDLSGRTITFPYCAPLKLESVAIDNKTISDLFQARKMLLDALAVEESARQGEGVAPRPLTSIRMLDEDIGVKELSDVNAGFTATENAWRFLQDNPGILPRQILPGTRVTIPTIGIDATVPLQFGVSLEEARRLLAAASAADQVNAITNGDVETAELISDYPPPMGECALPSEGYPWPFDTSAYVRALETNARLRPFDAPPAQTVLVIDTGYTTAFDLSAIWPDATGTMRGNGVNSFKRFIGINTATGKDDPAPPSGLVKALHGNEVAATLLGGRFLGPDVDIPQRPEVVFASVAQEAGRGPYLSSAAITRAYRRGIASDVAVINISLAAKSSRDDFLSTVKGKPGALLVTAAGNATTNRRFPSSNGKWPGSLGGASRIASPGVIVSVGAHAPNGKLLSTSRYGLKQVDILAPGCNISTYSFDETTGERKDVDRNGTSFAAPLVSFVAAQLAAETLSPAKIKDRLALSADVDERLAQKVWSGGRLDAPKAISIYQDHVEFNQAGDNGNSSIEKVSGQLLNINDNWMVCGVKHSLKSIRKFARSEHPDNPSQSKWRGWIRVENGIDRFQDCSVNELPVGKIVIQRSSDGKIFKLEANKVIDFVPRYGED